MFEPSSTPMTLSEIIHQAQQVRVKPGHVLEVHLYEDNSFCKRTRPLKEFADYWVHRYAKTEKSHRLAAICRQAESPTWTILAVIQEDEILSVGLGVRSVKLKLRPHRQKDGPF